MPAPTALIAAWARSAVVPCGGAFKGLRPHEIAAPVVQALLHRAGVAPQMVDAIVVGNAMGAGGNPARMVALAAQLPEHCATYSVDTQCCSGLDAVTMAVGLLASGQASVVIAGGVEAWSRAPIRMHRPTQEGEPPVAFERPAFTPAPSRDPDMLVSAARYALDHSFARAEQDAYALHSHQRALAHQSDLSAEIVVVAGTQHDVYPRPLDARRAARMPAAVKPSELGKGWHQAAHAGPDCSISAFTISAKADGAAFVLLASAETCGRLNIHPQSAWITGASIGSAPETPLVAAEMAARAAMLRAGVPSAGALRVIELHDAFAVQGLSFCQNLALDPQRVNRRGGGLARGHPIGASAAIALVRLLADLSQDESTGAQGLVAVAGAGGIGAAAIVEKI